MRSLLKPLVPLYRAGLAWKNRRFDQGTAPMRRLARPVISVGSLSAGGAGKTPVVLALADLLAEHGVAVDILSRGYGRSSKDALQVNANGTAADFGDEALLAARRGYGVFVAAERFEAGRLAEETRKDTVHLLDDGMQHRRLHRDFEIVLLTRTDVEDTLLPAGNLREPLSELRRADAVVVRQEELPSLREVVQRYAPQVKIWTIARRLHLASPAPRKAFVFCGIARPEGFFSMLEAAGVGIVGKRVFADHHPYTRQELDGIVREAARMGCDAIVTTEKDAVKIPMEMQATMPGLLVAPLHGSWTDAAEVWSQLQETLR